MCACTYRKSTVHFIGWPKCTRVKRHTMQQPKEPFTQPRKNYECSSNHFFYHFHLYWLTCIFFLPWPRTLGLWNYWNVCTILKHLFKSCFSLKGRYYSQIQSQIKKNKQILSLQALHIGMYQRTYRLPFPFWHSDNSPAPQAESWSTCLQPFQIHRPNRKRKKMSKITNKTVDLQKQRGLQMNNF